MWFLVDSDIDIEKCSKQYFFQVVVNIKKV